MRTQVVRILRKPRFTTTNTEWADKSRFQFGVVTSEDGSAESFTLSILGFVNGILPSLTGCVVVVNDPENTFSVRKKWW